MDDDFGLTKDVQVAKLGRDKVVGLKVALVRPELVRWLVLSGSLMDHIGPIEVPQEVSRLTNLEVLEIENYNTVTFTSALSGLGKLATVFVQGNQFSPAEVVLDEGVAGIAHLRTLVVDQFSPIRVTQGFAACAKLERLHIGEDRLEGLSHVCRVVSLRELILDTPVKEDLSCLQRLTNLVRLRLSCGLNEVPDVLRGMFVRELSLSSNPLTVLPDWLGGLPLEELDISYTQVSVLPAGFKDLKRLNIKGSQVPPSIRQRFPDAEVIIE